MFRREIGLDAEIGLVEMRHASELFDLMDRNREYLRQWLPWLDNTRTREDMEGFIQRSLGQFSHGEGLVAGIWHRGRLAGLISYVWVDSRNRSAMIGYWIGAEYQHRGLVTRACEALIDYGFAELGLNRIVIKAAVGNLRSQAVPGRLGFTRERVERQGEWLHDRFVDDIVFAMLRSEWESSTGRRKRG